MWLAPTARRGRHGSVLNTNNASFPLRLHSLSRMNRPRLLLALASLFASLLFIPGIRWGLPSRASDAFLFGSHRPWTGKEIIDLAGGWDDAANRGSDVALHPLEHRDETIVLNETDAQRAQIVRRFRLYSSQPDELITLRALSRMKPGQLDLDPKFYQYGGLWVYGVAAMTKAAAVLHFVTLKGDLAYYLNHSEEFGKLYVVMRSYSVLWGLIGVVVSFKLLHEWIGRPFPAFLGAMIYASMPVVVNAAHEAKPHLAGAVLTFAAVWSAARFLRNGKTRWAVWTAVFCAAAGSMALTGLASLLVVPTMLLLAPMNWRKRIQLLQILITISVITFAILNPYLLWNLAFHRDVVQSNMGNTGAMYSPHFSGNTIANALRLITLGATPILAAAGFLVVLITSCLKMRQLDVRLRWIIFSAIAVTGIQFILLASAKPAEYARFAISIDIAVAVLFVAGLFDQVPRAAAVVCTIALIACAAQGQRYTRAAIKDDTRRAAAEELQSKLNSTTHKTLLLEAEPSPYCFPPANLFDWKIVLLPRSVSAENTSGFTNATYVRTSDSASAAPIGWADKAFEIATELPASTTEPAKRE